jgi:hypothetical protein
MDEIKVHICFKCLSMGIANKIMTNLNPMKINWITSTKLPIPCHDGYLIVTYLYNPRTFMVKLACENVFQMGKHNENVIFQPYTVMKDWLSQMNLPYYSNNIYIINAVYFRDFL